jgi:hypothetical protein
MGETYNRHPEDVSGCFTEYSIAVLLHKLVEMLGSHCIFEDRQQEAPKRPKYSLRPHGLS